MDENFRRLHEYVAHDKYLEAKLYLEDLSSNLQNELSESIIGRVTFTSDDPYD